IPPIPDSHIEVSEGVEINVHVHPHVVPAFLPDSAYQILYAVPVPDTIVPRGEPCASQRGVLLHDERQRGHHVVHPDAETLFREGGNIELVDVTALVDLAREPSPPAASLDRINVAYGV